MEKKKEVITGVITEESQPEQVEETPVENESSDSAQEKTKTEE